MLVGDVLMSSEENELFTEVGELGRLLMKDVGIICLQETWLSKQELNCLNTLHTDFHGSGVANSRLQRRAA